MAIQFNNIPDNLRVPLWYAEINPAQTPYQSISRLLLVGQKLASGTAAANEPIMVTREAEGLFGVGSMLADMYRVARLNGPFQEIWALPLTDLVSGTAASGTITVGTITGVLRTTNIQLWVAGVQVRTYVTPTDTPETLAARVNAAINATPGLPVVGTVGADPNDHIITLAARHKGLAGNSIRIEFDLFGDQGPLAASLLTVVQPTGGAGDPDLAPAFANLGDQEFDFIAGPYSDAASMEDVAALLNGISGRWSPYQQLYGMYFTAKNDTAANLSTFGNTMNDEHISVMGTYRSPSPIWQWAAAVGCVAAVHLQAAPELSRPLQTLDLLGIRPPKLQADRFDKVTRQSHYYDGISGYQVERDGTVSIDRLITTYQLNEWGSPDPSFLDVNTLAQAVYSIRYLKQKVTSHWGRAALADENPGGIVGLATPADVKATIIHGYRELQDLAVVENIDEFERRLIVERNATDANRLDVLLPADVVNQLRIIAVNYVSHLRYGNA